MKKLIVILLLLGYGLSSFGMTLHVHYCCGRIDKIDITPVKSDKCPVDKKTTKKGCCDDRQVELKIKTDYKNEPSALLKCKSFNDVLLIDNFSTAVFIAVNDSPVHYKEISSPSGAYIPLYKKNCTYRI
jgi:hypothetical protein